jgi:hypothetical protein
MKVPLPAVRGLLKLAFVSSTADTLALRDRRGLALIFLLLVYGPGVERKVKRGTGRYRPCPKS